MNEVAINADAALAKTCIVSCLTSNHANTLPLLEILRACREPRPYREVEDGVYELPIMHMSHQNPHMLSEMLINCGALKIILVEEEPADASLEETSDTANIVTACEEDQPIDYLLAITPAGEAALADFEPTKRFSEMMSEEPEGYGAVYKNILKYCVAGVATDTIELRLKDHPSLHNPKIVFAGYFISKLESIGGIAWEDNQWITTETGKTMMAML